MENTKTALETRPETIAIVALGPTSSHYHLENSKKKKLPHYDEIWTVNSANYIKCDKAWIMDDLRRVAKRYPEWTARLQASKDPIITCRAYPEYPTAVEYPIEEVTSALKEDYFAVTPAYMIAYALYIGVKTAYIYGCDFYYPGSLSVESGAACVAYWLGIARERRMVFKIPHDSTLLDAHLAKIEGGAAGKRYRYGYDYNPGDSYNAIQAGQASQLDMLVAAGGKINEALHATKPQTIVENVNAKP